MAAPYTCSGISEVDHTAGTLCRRLLDLGSTPRELDRPLHTVNYPRPNRPRSRVRGPDGKVTPVDIYEAAIQKFEQGDESVRSILTRDLDFQVPWPFRKKEHLQKVLEKIAETGKSLKDQGLSDRTLPYNRALARELGRFTRAEKGFGVSGGYPACPGELTSDEAIEKKCADCTEFSMLYYEMARLAGLKPTFLQFTLGEEGKPFSWGHVGVGVRINPKDPGKVTPVDLSYYEDDGLGVRHRHWFEISRRSMLAYYHMGLAIDPPPRLASEEKLNYRFQELIKALRYDPRNGYLHHVMGGLYLEISLWDLAIKEFREALRRNPHDKGARYYLGVAYERRRASRRD